MGERERKSMLTAAALLCAAALARFLIAGAGPAPVPLEGRLSIADSLVAAGDSAAEEKARRSRPLESGERIDPNAAGEVELDRLPGVGPATAARIVEERENAGPFAGAADLARVRGIGPAAVERMRPFLDVQASGARSGAGRTGPAPGVRAREAGRSSSGGAGTASRGATASGQSRPASGPAVAARPVDVNRAAVEELSTLPGIGPVTAGRIVAFREANGSFARPEDLMQVKGIGPKTFARIAALVRVRE